MVQPISLIFLAAVVSASPLSLRQNRNTTNATTVYSFKDIPVTADLKWTSCFDNFTCVNLEVPLDYEKLDVGTTNIAFLRWETPNQPPVGDILINPGGPGGSGVSYAKDSWETLTRTFGDKYNIIGMDPRGVNNSGPNVNCFKDLPATRDYYTVNLHYLFDSKSPTALDRYYAESAGFGEYCSQMVGDEANYANTPATAHDMLHYIELLTESHGEPKENAKLNYYGVSYGSVLGSTYAALFPDRVGRMIIDGVMDVEDYYQGSWLPDIQQGDEAVRGFATKCFEAGNNCAFFRNNSSADEIQQRLDAIIEDISKSPIPLTDPNLVQFPATITHMDVRSAMFDLVYNSYENFPGLAFMLSGLETRNGSLLAIQSGKGKALPSECEGPKEDYSFALTKYFIGCTDQDGRYNISDVHQWYEYVEKAEAISSYIGAPWSKIMTVQCRKLRFSPPESQRFHGFHETKTSNPILFTNNKIDPVTSSPEKVSSLFPGSVILKQDAIGHGVMISDSDCTSEHLTRYMETGELPPPNTMCEMNKKVFDVEVPI